MVFVWKLLKLLWCFVFVVWIIKARYVMSVTGRIG